MTAIAGYVDKKSGKTYIATDSQGSNRFTKYNFGTKIIRKQNILFAMTGTFRFREIIEHELDIPKRKVDQTIGNYVYVDLRKAMVEAFKEGNAISKSDEHIQINGGILFAIEDKLYYMQGDTSILEHELCFDAGGSGTYHTEAVIQALDKHTDMKPDEILTEAINICSNYVMSVGGDVHVEVLEHKKKEV